MPISQQNTQGPLYVTRPFLPPRAEFDAEVDRIFASARLTNNGGELRRFQAALCRVLGAQAVSLFANGHLALEAALRVLACPQKDAEKAGGPQPQRPLNGAGCPTLQRVGNGPGSVLLSSAPRGEVITTPFTFPSTVHAIVRCGLTPVFCDIRESDLTLDPQQLEQCITPATRAILPVHVYGHPCDTAAIGAVARRYGLPVLYDGAHAFGVAVNGQSLALQGQMTMLSFHATKPFHTIEGGALVLNGEGTPGTSRLMRQAAALEQEKDFGIAAEGAVPQAGGNAKMNEFEAAMGLCCLPYLPQITARRQALTMRYRQNLAGRAGLHFFVPEAAAGVEYNYAYFPVLIDPDSFGSSRDAVWQALREKGIFARRYFWPAVPDLECYRAGYGEAALPAARRAAGRALCLPLYDSLTFAQVDRVCAAVLAAGL